MELVRIGNKVIDRTRLYTIIDNVLDLRAQGFSQQQVADKLRLHRPFVSRLEKMGELRRGKTIGVLAFPIANKEELDKVLQEEGVDFSIVMTDKERWNFIGNKNGIELFNEIMDMITKMRTYDVVIVIGSNYRIKLCEATLDKEVIGIEIGKSPIESDKYVDVEKIRELIRQLLEKDSEKESIGQ